MGMFNHIPLITVLTGNNLAHSSCVGSERIKELLEKTSVLKSALLAHLTYQFLPFATVKNLTKPSIEKELLEKTRVLNSDFLTELNKISYLTPPKNMERDYLVTEPKIQLSDVKKIPLHP